MAQVEIAAPMAGSVKEVLVATGESVGQGQELLLMESMKMEIPVESPAPGKVTEILVSAPQPIVEGQVLIRLDA